MINFDFDYYQEENAKEAIYKYLELSEKNEENVLYYNGGTEIITYARKNKIEFSALIDIQNILECSVLKNNQKQIIIGASVSLNMIIEKNYFPLLSDSCKGIADHTTRNQITIGGNLTGKLPYKEAVLPLLVGDVELKIMTQNGIKIKKINQLFDKRLQLEPEDILLQIIVDKNVIDLPYVQIREVKQSEIDYPIMHLVALKQNDKIKASLSSLCAFPFRDKNLETIINDNKLTRREKIDQIVNNLPVPISSNYRGGKDYKEMLFRNSLNSCLDQLGSGI